MQGGVPMTHSCYEEVDKRVGWSMSEPTRLALTTVLGEFILKGSSKLLDIEARPGKDTEVQHRRSVQVMVKFSV